jgi:hypothetical protein
VSAAADILHEPMVTAKEAARQIGVHPKTVREWRREGAPCARPGGPGRPTLFYVSELLAWKNRHADPAFVFEQLTDICRDTFMHESPELGNKAHVALRIDPGLAGGLYLAVLERAYLTLFRKPVPDVLPTESGKQLAQIVRAYTRRTNA